jgi:hypothetical protein
MKKGVLVTISAIITITGLIILVSSLTMTGNVISEDIGKTSERLIGLVLVIGGMLLFLASKREKVERRLEQMLDSGKVGTYDELERYAKKMGYEIKEGKKHREVYLGDTYVTDIPRHKGTAKKGLYRKIIRDLISAAA